MAEDRKSGPGGNSDVVVALVALAMGLLLGTVAGWIGGDAGGYHDAYRQGQVDALSGARVVYELRKQPTGETVWVEKK